MVPPEISRPLSPGTYEYVMLHGKGDFADVFKVTVLVFIASVTNYHRFSVLKLHKLIIS